MKNMFRGIILYLKSKKSLNHIFEFKGPRIQRILRILTLKLVPIRHLYILIYKFQKTVEKYLAQYNLIIHMAALKHVA